MPVTAEWYDEAQAIIHLRFFGVWTNEEFWEADKTLIHLSRQTSGRFDIISDTTQASYTPPIGILWEWQQMATVRHTEFPNWGLTVYAAPSHLLKAYFDEAVQTCTAIRQHGRLAQSLDEAIRIIQVDRVMQQSSHG